MSLKTVFNSMPRTNWIVFLTGLVGIVVGAIGIKLSHDPSLIKFFDNLHWTSGTATAAVLAWVGRGQTGRQKSSGTLLWFAVGFTGYAIGQVIWDAQVALSYNKFPSPSDLFYLWLGPCLAMGLIQEIRGKLPRMNHPINGS